MSHRFPPLTAPTRIPRTKASPIERLRPLPGLPVDELLLLGALFVLLFL